MEIQKNIGVVQQALADLRQGNILGVLEKLTDDICWHAFGLSESLPGSNIFYGKEQVKQFLTRLSRLGEFQRFEPQEFMAKGEQVVVLGQAEKPAAAGRGTHRLDWSMIFE